jgi:hypothetical protein
LRRFVQFADIHKLEFQNRYPQLTAHLAQEAEEKQLAGASIPRKLAFEYLCENM